MDIKWSPKADKKEYLPLLFEDGLVIGAISFDAETGSFEGKLTPEYFDQMDTYLRNHLIAFGFFARINPSRNPEMAEKIQNDLYEFVRKMKS